MPKFTLIAEHTDLYGNPDGTKVNYEFNGTYLPEILEHVDLFLKGCGFNPDGTLDYVPDEEYYGEPEWNTEEFNTDPVESFDDRIWKQSVDNVNHSEYYFDTERNK